jgi:hypothetical protein
VCVVVGQGGVSSRAARVTSGCGAHRRHERASCWRAARMPSAQNQHPPNGALPASCHRAQCTATLWRHSGTLPTPTRAPHAAWAQVHRPDEPPASPPLTGENSRQSSQNSFAVPSDNRLACLAASLRGLTSRSIDDPQRRPAVSTTVAETRAAKRDRSALTKLLLVPGPSTSSRRQQKGPFPGAFYGRYWARTNDPQLVETAPSFTPARGGFRVFASLQGLHAPEAGRVRARLHSLSRGLVVARGSTVGA